MGASGRLRVRRAGEQDLGALAGFSHQMHQEQRRDVDLSLDQLKERLRQRLSSDSVAIIFEVGETAVGYTLVSAKNSPLEVFEYFLKPEERGKGYGYAFVAMTMSETNASALDVDSVVWREAAGAM